eukprot:8608771-Heterocapsa_arctica.AAC.1
MRHYRQGRAGSDDTHRERTNCQVNRHAEDRIKLGRPQCEATDWTYSESVRPEHTIQSIRYKGQVSSSTRGATSGTQRPPFKG